MLLLKFHAQVPERLISTKSRIKNFVPFLYLPSYALLRVTFYVIIIESCRKEKTVFCKL